MVELLSKMATSQLCILEYFSINLSNSLSANNCNLLHIQLILFLWCFFFPFRVLCVLMVMFEMREVSRIMKNIDRWLVAKSDV